MFRVHVCLTVRIVRRTMLPRYDRNKLLYVNSQRTLRYIEEAWMCAILVAGWFKWGLRNMKLILLVISPRGSGIYIRPEGRGNCSSGKRRNEKDRRGCLYICLQLFALRPENYYCNFDRTSNCIALFVETLFAPALYTHLVKVSFVIF